MSELKDRYEKICDELEKAADEKMGREIGGSQAYNQGYKRACEDYFKRLSRSLREKSE